MRKQGKIMHLQKYAYTPLIYEKVKILTLSQIALSTVDIILSLNTT